MIQTQTYPGRNVFSGSPSIFTRYRCSIQIRDRIFGGTPSNPELIEAWLRAKAGIDDAEEVRRALVRIMGEIGHRFKDTDPDEAVFEASRQLAEQSVVSFKRDENGLYIETRQIKAMLKESVNILYPGDYWGKYTNRKGDKEVGGKLARNYVAERVFVEGERAYLGVQERSGVQTNAIHAEVQGRKVHTLAKYEYVERPLISFVVLSLAKDDAITDERWGMIWQHAQKNGIGANRSQGNGCFDVVEWEREG